MAEIHCPVCGTSNSEELERCKACNQLLRQDTSELHGGGKSFRPGETPTEKDTSELEKVLPAWLRRARQTDQNSEKESAPEATEEPQEPQQEAPVLPETPEETEAEKELADPMDWLAGLNAEDDDDDEEAADWLVNLQGDIAEEKPSEEEAPTDAPADETIQPNIPPAPTVEEGESLDWIASVQGDAVSAADDLPDLTTTEKTPVEETLDGDGALPDWLARLSQEAEEAEKDAEIFSVSPVSEPEADAELPAGEAEDALPDWMSDLQANAIGEVTLEEPVAPPAAENIEEIPPAAPEESVSPTAEEALPDWLGGEDAQPPAAQEAEPAAIAADDLPDWLSSQEGGTEVTSPDGEEAIPDWLSDGEVPPVESTEEATPGQAVASDLPDWMANLEGIDDPPSEASMPAFGGTDSLPEWIGETTSAPADDEGVAEEEPAEVEDDTPDWLAALPSEDFSDLGQEAESALVQAATDETETDSQVFAPSADAESISPAEELPDWLSRMGKPETDPLSKVDLPDEQPPAIEEPVSEPIEEEETPQEVPSGSPAFVEDDFTLGEDSSDEIFGIEMPDWLSSLAPAEVDAASAEESEAAESEEDLSGAELPSWVQAMRPVASVVSDSRKTTDDMEQVIASSGPLAGLAGILPAGAELIHRNKPRAHSIKLSVNESQQSSAAVLDALLAAETEASFSQHAVEKKTLPLLRWGIALLLVLVIGFSLVTQTTMTPSPKFAPREINDANQAIQGLSGAGSALLVFDYEAGLSAEMETAAAPLIDHLMLRGENFAVLSTSPMGSVLAERFLAETQASHQYQPGADYVNLGYLPGGASGILSFVSSPRTALRAQLDGLSVWGLPPLANVANLTDFSIVVILTDDVEKGRTWIEQASASLNAAATPFLVVASAQAEPVIYPYYASGQVDGLVAGLAGGATYERLQGQTGLGRKYWDAYSLGLLLAEILIVVGASINFLASLRRQPDKDEN